MDENGDNVVLETSVSKFQNGETIIGDTSKSSAKIIVDDYDNNKKLYITSQQRFDIGEKVITQTSGASAVITDYKQTLYKTFNNFLHTQMLTIPYSSFLTSSKNLFFVLYQKQLQKILNQRNLIKNIKDLYDKRN